MSQITKYIVLERVGIKQNIGEKIMPVFPINERGYQSEYNSS